MYKGACDVVMNVGPCEVYVGSMLGDYLGVNIGDSLGVYIGDSLGIYADSCSKLYEFLTFSLFLKLDWSSEFPLYCVGLLIVNLSSKYELSFSVNPLSTLISFLLNKSSFGLVILDVRYYYRDSKLLWTDDANFACRYLLPDSCSFLYWGDSSIPYNLSLTSLTLLFTTVTPPAI